MKPERWAPPATELVRVHALHIAHPDAQYHYEGSDERHAALLEPLSGMALGAYDQRILRWLTGWDISVVAVIVSLLWRVRHAAIQAHGDGGDSR